MSTSPVFPGFRRPTDNFTKIPNEWFDICARVIDNLSELKVVLYVIRHTWGFQDYDQLKPLTVDEFVRGRKSKGERMDQGCGLAETAVKQGIARAIKDGYLICEVDDSDKGRVRKFYGLKMLPIDELGGHIATPPSHDATPDSRNTTPQGRNATLNQAQHDPRTEKEPLERELNKDTEKKESATLTADQLHWFESVFCCSQMGKRKLTKTLEGHIITLSASISTIEELNSLVAHTQSQPYLIDKTIQAGNLVYHLSDWEKKQQDEAAAMAVLKPATEEYPEEPIPGPDAALPEDLVQWITGLSIRWQDEHNIEANRAILTAIYRQAGKGEIAFWDHLTGTLRGKWAQEKPVHERMDYLFGMLCERLRVPLPYASSS